MLVIGGLIFMLASILGGYTALGGKLAVLWQPFEFVIIAGSAAGAFIVANPPYLLKKVGSSVWGVFQGPKNKQEDYKELLALLYALFKFAQIKGAMALESHADRPEESPIFQEFPIILAKKGALTFLCDYLRLLTMGTSNPFELEALMDEDIETHHYEEMQVVSALQTTADALPALGIIAAVLGVIKTMGAIGESPEILGHLIGAALVGTFLGVLLSYGCVGPIASAARTISEADLRYYVCIKAGLLAHLRGCAPAISVEFARKALLSEMRPTFYEVEEMVSQIPVLADKPGTKK